MCLPVYCGMDTIGVLSRVGQLENTRTISRVYWLYHCLLKHQASIVYERQVPGSSHLSLRAILVVDNPHNYN